MTGNCVKPPIFEYVAAESIDQAVGLLAAGAGAAKVLAGGQSLTPMLNFRLLDPELLIDVSRIPALAEISERDGFLSVGACARHRDILDSELVARRFPIIPAAIRHVAHMAIRNRGTIGGSIAHADPAAEAPLLAVLLDAELEIAGPAGRRLSPAAAFFLGPLFTDLAEDELLVAIRFPYASAGAGWGFHETARRAGDFALAGAGAALDVRDGAIASVRLAVMGVDDTPRRLQAAEELLVGAAWDASARAAVLDAVRAGIAPTNDLQASADYRRHLAGVMAGRALDDAWSRATGSAG